MGGVIDHPDVLALFARQRWIASVEQLRALGVGPAAIRRACAAGLIERVSPGVYRIASAELDFEGKCIALLLRAPTGSYISGMSAARLYGLRNMPSQPVELTVPDNVRRRAPAWARVVRCTSAIDERDVVKRPDGIVLASPARTLFRLAAVFNQFRFERAAEDMWHRNLLSPSQAADYLADIRRSGRTGVAAMDRWLARALAMGRPSASGLEQKLLSLVVGAGLPEPVRQFPLRLLNGDLIHIDLAWPDIRFGLEPGHTWWHGGDLRARSDQARDRACTEVGWHVVRVDEVDIDAPGLPAQVCRMFEQQSLLVTGRPRPPAA
jgi:hypothetical protein